jgi:hypothetical protein
MPSLSLLVVGLPALLSGLLGPTSRSGCSDISGLGSHRPSRGPRTAGATTALDADELMPSVHGSDFGAESGIEALASERPGGAHSYRHPHGSLGHSHSPFGSREGSLSHRSSTAPGTHAGGHAYMPHHAGHGHGADGGSSGREEGDTTDGDDGEEGDDGSPPPVPSSAAQLVEKWEVPQVRREAGQRGRGAGPGRTGAWHRCPGWR